jgi:transmembrane sensor
VSPAERRPDNRRAPDEVAADWQAFLSSDEATADDRLAFTRWRQSDPRHDAAARRLEATQQLLTRLNADDLPSDLRDELERISPRARVTRFPSWWQSLAAMLALLATVAVGLRWYENRPDATVLTVATAEAAETLKLADGSEVVVGPSGRLHVNVSSDQREVQLLAGEAEFNVTSDPNRPFLVVAGDVTVRVIGTVFRVRRDEETAVEVDVTEGRVHVGHRREEADNAKPRLDLLLSAGERIRWERGPTGSHAIVSQPALTPGLVDPAPHLNFINTPLVRALQEFNRYGIVQLELADPALGDRIVAGRFKADAAEAFASLLAGPDSGILLERPEPNLIVLRQAQ